MAYDEGLAFRIRELLNERRDVMEKSMFGGIAFLIDGSMSVGVVGEDLVARVGTARHEEALARPHARVMDFTGRPMKGWIFVAPLGTEDDQALADWVEWGVQTALQAGKSKAGVLENKSKGLVPQGTRARQPKRKRPARLKS